MGDPKRIMISSTVRDLPEHREHAMDACLEVDMFPVMMEHLPALDEDAVSASIAMVDEADIYLLILAHRYGYVPKEHNPRKISITEMEYDRAVERGIPRIVLVMHDDHPLKATDVETGRGAGKLRRFKKRVGIERVNDTFKSPEDLEGKIILALVTSRESNSSAAHVTANQIVGATQPAEITYLHQLPPLFKHFTDRVDEVTLLQDKVQNDTQIYGFFGVGGIGKTDLAKRFVYEHLLERYPDAQFFVKLGGTTKDPKSVPDAQAHVISSFGNPGKTWEVKEVDLTAKYNSALFGKRILLFLDDASNQEQVLPLTPPANCAMVITSRQKLYLPGIYTTIVPPLKLKDACDLLVTIAPRIGSHAERIAELCGGFPFALCLAARAIVEREDLDVEEYIERLADRNERLALIEGTLDLSYDLLSPELQRRFARLAIFPESFDASGAAAIWNRPLKEAKDSLSDLVKFSLLEYYPRAGRYSLQPLVRDFADAQLTDSERLATQSLHAFHYLHVLREAGRRYLQGDKVSSDGLNLFDVERSNIRASQSWFENNVDEKLVCAALSSNFSYAGSRLLALKQTPQERIKWHEATLTAAKTTTDIDQEPSKRLFVEAGNLIFLANAYRDLGSYDKTISYCEEALLISAVVNDARLESTALGYLGIAHYYKGHYEEAATHVQKALGISQKTQPVDRETEAELLRYLGHAYRGLGDYDQAIQQYELSLETARQSGDLSAENNALGALGRIHCDAGQQELARTEYLNKALDIAVEIVDQKAESYALAHLGLAHRDLGFYAEAIEYYNKALNLAVQIGHKQVATYSNGGLGKTYLLLEDFRNAQRHTLMAVNLAGEINMTRAQQFWETMLAQTYLFMGEADNALTAIEKTLSYGSRWVNYRTHALHGLIQVKRGQLELAGESFKQAAADAEKVLSKTPRYFDAQYLLGLTLGGMALVNQPDRATLIAQCSSAFEKAYATCPSRGVVAEALRLYDELLSVDAGGELRGPRDLLRRITTT